MRRLFRAALAAMALAIAGPAMPSLAQTPPNVLIVGQIAEPQSLDPHTVTATNDFRILVNIYDGLVRYKDGTLEVEPALAESWTISDDGKTYRFKLRQGIKFHDGSDFNAEAVKFNFDRMLKEDHPFYNTGPFPLSFNFSSIEAVNAIDPTTVEFKLKEPFAPFLSNLAYPTGLIVSPEAVKKYGKEFGRHPSGTGPFKFTEWQSGQRVVVERNPDYWDGAPALEAVVFRPITDPNTRVAEMMAGGLDVMVEVPPDNLATFKQDANFAVAEQAGPHVWFTILNAKTGPFADKKVRQAANYAVNRQALVDNVLQGSATVAAGPIPPAFNWVEDKTEAYPYDPEKAKALLAEAGVTNPEITFYVTEGGSGMLDPITMGAAIQADLQAVGFKVKIETYEWNTFLGRVNTGLEGKADMAEMAWMTNDPDTVPYLTLRTDALPDKGGFNSGYYSNPQLDALLEKARTSNSQAERGKLYGEVQAIVHDDAPWLFVANWKQNAVTTAAVKGLKLQPSFLLHLKTVTKE
ncbi:ABC transporter substrate-binding protein [Ochrobactrum soli]|uniref:ABC transporter substrate-binding protein n=1 Tax=Brucella/Ochrobactrum group TaxID=2826938 RepID=UPI000EF22001|nr:MULTISPECIES: ABC transporter substrate-binding protein [Brucella]RLL74633.1 ABC transporter substrate-binding protein [[Ochrobactrum] soli]WHS29653.1 ABC transporter substrate-binding protein [Brucella sp. NM4]WHT44870.1 ABC transporter substrate-binding protein [Ochrobactrum sp. SSR]